MGINNKNYGSNSTVIVEQNEGSVNTKARVLNMAKVYLYLGLELLITGVVAFGLGFAFHFWMQSDPNGAKSGLLAILITSGVLAIIMCFVLSASMLGKGKLVKPIIFVYTILMGVLISTLVMYVDWRILGMAFGITCAIFLVDALIASFIKKDLNWVAFAAVSMIFGAGICALITLPFTLIMPANMIGMVWAIDIIFFIAINLITLVDIVRMNKIAETGAMEGNLALYCSFTIYVDFIYIFIKLVYYLGLANRS